MVKTFDIVGSLNDVDTKAFEVSNVVAKSQPTFPPPDVFAPHFDNDALKAQLDNAYNSHIQAYLPKPEVEDPTLDATLKAAFQSGNTIGSALSSDTLRETLFPTRDAKQLTDDEILDQVGKAGLMPLALKFQGVTNQAQLDARVADIKREQKNLEILEASGATGVVAQLVAGVIDVPTLLPVGRALQLGRKGASLLEATAKTAAAGVIDAGVSEAGLQATQETRTPEDAVISVASGAILGGVLGASIHKLVGGEVASKVEGDLDKYREDAANGFPEARAAQATQDAEYAKANDLTTTPTGSVGAAFSDIAAEAAALGKKSDAKVTAFWLDKIPNITTVPTEWLSKVLGGKTLLGRPRDAFRGSTLDTVRQFARMFYSAPEITEAQAEGRVIFKGMTVEDHIGEDLGKLSEFKAEMGNIYAANSSRFRNVNELAERAYYAALNEGIDVVSNDPALEAAARAFNKYADYQHAKHVANGRLPEDTAVMGSKGGYVRRSYNQNALRNNEETAREMLYQWALRKVTQDADELDAGTQYTERLARYEQSVASFEERKSRRESDFVKNLAEWKMQRDSLLTADEALYQADLDAWQQTLDNLKAADASAYQSDLRAWRDRRSEFLSDPANDGKSARHIIQPKKKTYNSARTWLERNPKPVKEELATVSGGETNKPRMEKVKNSKYNKAGEFLDENPRPRKGEAETLTDGNAKPALPRGKGGFVLTKNEVPEQARLLSEDVYNTLAGVKSQVPRASLSRVGVRTGYLKGRVVDIPDDVLGDSFFLRTNLLEHAETMHYTSGRDAALGSVFKMVDDKGQLVGDYDGNSILLAAEEEANAVINETTGEAKTRLIEQRDRMLEGVKNEIAIARGGFNVGSGLIGAEAAHSIASITYLNKLGGVTVTSLTDAPKIAIANGLGDTFRYGVMPMLRDFRATISKNGPLRQQAIRVGNVVEILHNTRMADAFELNNPHAVSSTWGKYVDKATKLATQMSLIAHWTDLGKMVAHNIASSRMLGYADIGWERLSQKNRAWLANLGLDADDLAKVKAEYGNQDLKHVAGVLFADLDKWGDQELAARFAAAYRREGRNVVVAPGLGDRPQFSHTPAGKLINQFQTFMLADQVRFVARQAQLSNIGTDGAERTRQRLAFGAGLSSLVMGAVFVDSMKRALRENDADWEKFVTRWERNPGGSMYDAIDRAGFMGSLFNASNTAGKFTNGVFSIRGGTQWLAGDKDPGDARKVRDIGLGGALLGPAAGMAEDTVKVGQAVGKAATGGTPSRADLRRFQNLLPYHAVPGIQQALNAANDVAAGAFGLPPEAKNLGK